MTAGNGTLFGRINCKELCEEIRARADGKKLDKE